MIMMVVVINAHEHTTTYRPIAVTQNAAFGRDTFATRRKQLYRVCQHLHNVELQLLSQAALHINRRKFHNERRLKSSQDANDLMKRSHNSALFSSAVGTICVSLLSVATPVTKQKVSGVVQKFFGGLGVAESSKPGGLTSRGRESAVNRPAGTAAFMPPAGMGYGRHKPLSDGSCDLLALYG
ncbi:hypothetical protein HPB51_013650 [Rhipicephalus microplus]|uniref:Uncharacterized protein n=1 Tax=Rhipicephalus microplus TaxID=6941 RepID=A0A9J6EAB7_RHIMP|nr:hypothetical protein HPB51_013650 [Rhipicephalus microplus]